MTQLIHIAADETSIEVLIPFFKSMGPIGALFHKFLFYPDMSEANIVDTRKLLYRDIRVHQDAVHEMAALAELVAQDQGMKYLRVDFYNTLRGILWGEACVTPGFVLRGKLTEEADKLIGSWIPN